jgi:hypothetical protein
MKQIIMMVYLCIMAAGIKAQTDVTVTAITKEMSKGTRPGYKVNIPENTLKDVKNAWENLLRENSKGKLQTVNAETSMIGAVSIQISASPINIYSQLEETNGQVIIYAFFQLTTDSSFVSAASKDRDAGARKYLHDFATRLFKASVQKMADEEMKKLLEAERLLDSRLRDEQKAKMEILMLNCDIKRTEDDNVFIVKEQAFNEQQIARQKDLIERSKGKADEITGKAKGKPESTNSEAQKALDNLTKEKLKLEKDAQKNILDGNLDRDKIKDREKNIERALKDQATQKAVVAAQKQLVDKLLTKLSTIK